MKPRLPYGQLPTIKVEGEVICTSMAIARYRNQPRAHTPHLSRTVIFPLRFLAEKYGLAGNNNLERAQADEIGREAVAK